jgi:hypothetical protein
LWLRRSEVIEEVTVHVEEIRKEKKEKKLKPVIEIPKAIIRLEIALECSTESQEQLTLYREE